MKTHLVNAPQIVVDGVESTTNYRFLTPEGEYLGEVKITTMLKALARLALFVEFGISLPFTAELFNHEGQMIGTFKKS